MLKIDHFYIKCTDLDKAISFYEKVLGMKAVHREGDRWADFDNDKGVYLGIFNAAFDNEKFKAGDNITPALKTDNIEKEYNRIKALKPKSISKMISLTQPALYKYFQFEDEWGNIWEVTEYQH